MKEYRRDNMFSFLLEATPAGYTEEEAIKYLLILNRTWWNNTYNTDVFDYEKIIYLEQAFPDNYQIQNLIEILKENIAKNYRLKQQYLNRLSDDIIDPVFTSYQDTIGFAMNDLHDSVLFSERGPRA